jgi:tyrosinase
MGSVPTTAQDPIFYLHHSNVDRLWNLWLAQGGGRTDPLLDAAWKSKTYVFLNENGHQVKMSACEILRAALQLNYVYECEPAEVNEYCFRRFPIWLYTRELVLRLPIPPVELNSETSSFPIELKEIRERLPSFVDNSKETVFLELDDVEAEKAPGIIWEVYFGLPAGTAADAKGPFFVGTVSLFGSGIRSEAHHEFKAALKDNGERLSVTFVPTGVVVEGKPTRPRALSPVRIGKASLVVERQKEQKEQEEK